jgi:A/G-specific adenine glycosylase
VTETATKKELWALAASLVPEERAGEYNQALMELGSGSVCRPRRHAIAARWRTFAWRGRGARSWSGRCARRGATRRTMTWSPASFTGTDGAFLIARRPPQGLLGGLWEFPGGKQEDGESLPEALRREIQEELAIEIAVGSSWGQIKHAYTHFRITLHAFQARHVAGEPQHIGVDGHAWVTLDDLDGYAFAVTDRKIIDDAAQRQRAAAAAAGMRGGWDRG